MLERELQGKMEKNVEFLPEAFLTYTSNLCL